MNATINGISMAYETHGAGEPILFIHGFPFSRRMWEPLIEPMKDDYKLILPDLRGFGESETSAKTSMDLYAADLVMLLDQIGEQRPVVLVALSMGGYVAFEFYRRYPERVRAIVLVDTKATADTDEAREERYRTAQQVLEMGSQVVADSMVGKLFAAEAEESLRSQWRDQMAEQPSEGLAAALRAMAVRPDSTDTLDDLNRATLIVVGQEDTITPPEMARAMHEAIAGSELEIISGAGHLPPVEQPQRFTAILLQFLDELEPLDQQGWPYQPDVDDL